MRGLQNDADICAARRQARESSEPADYKNAHHGAEQLWGIEARRLKELINAPMAQSGRPGAAGGFHVKRSRPRTGSERPVGRKDPQDFAETTKGASKMKQLAKNP